MKKGWEIRGLRSGRCQIVASQAIWRMARPWLLISVLTQIEPGPADQEESVAVSNVRFGLTPLFGLVQTAGHGSGDNAARNYARNVSILYIPADFIFTSQGGLEKSSLMGLFDRVGTRSARPFKSSSAIISSSEQSRGLLSPTDESSGGHSPCTDSSESSSVRSDCSSSYHSELMLRHIYKRARSYGWLAVEQEERDMQVALRVSRATEFEDASYLTAPHLTGDQSGDSWLTILDVAGYLQCEVILAMTNKVTSMLLKHLPPSVKTIPLDDTTNIQVIDTFEDFMSIRPAQSASFVREYNMLLIWSDDAKKVISLGRRLERLVVNLVWDEKNTLEQGLVLEKIDTPDIEHGGLENARSASLVTPTIVALAIMAIAAFIGQDLHEVVLQIKADTNYMACLIVCYFPVMAWLSAFFAQTFAVIVMQCCGPVSHLTINSKFYSGLRPRRKHDFELPQ